MATIYDQKDILKFIIKNKGVCANNEDECSCTECCVSYTCENMRYESLKPIDNLKIMQDAALELFQETYGDTELYKILV